MGGLPLWRRHAYRRTVSSWVIISAHAAITAIQRIIRGDFRHFETTLPRDNES